MKRISALLLLLIFAGHAAAIESGVAGQKLTLQVIDRTTGGPKTGDAANLTAYVSIDGDTTPDALGDTSATELSSTNLPGVYQFDLTQAETTGVNIVYGGKSATASVDVIARQIWTTPGNFNVAIIEENGSTSANVEKWLSTTVATPVTAGVPHVNVVQISGDSTAADNLEAYTDGTTHIPADAQKNAHHWYVDDGGNDSNDGKSWATAELTLAAAYADATDGDIIHVGAGTYAITTLQINKPITLEGRSPTLTIINTSTHPGIDVQVQGVILRNFATTCSASQGAGIKVFAPLVTIENVEATGDWDGLYLTGAYRSVLRRSKFTSTYDGANLSASGYTIIDQCEFVSSASDAVDEGFRALVLINSENVEIRNSNATIIRTGTSALGKATSAVEMNNSSAYVLNLEAGAAASNAAYTGAVYGIVDDTVGTSAVAILAMQGGSINTLSLGSGAVKDVHNNAAASSMLLADVKYDTAKVTSSGVRDTTLDTRTRAILALPSVAPAANGGLGTVDASNRIAGIQGTLTTLDALDTAQDVEHDATQAALVVIDDFIDTELAALTTAINTIDDFLDSEIATLITQTASIPTATQTANAILDKPLSENVTAATVGQAINWLKAAFTSSGIYSTGSLANAPTGAGTPVAAAVVDDSRTWFATEYRARNIVSVGDNYAGTLALQPDLNPGTTILTVDSVSITGAATVTATTLTTNRSKTRAHFTVPALTATGTYTVVVTVTTVDSQTIPTTCTLKVL